VRPRRALQETLAAEHAAVWVYGVLGGRIPASDNPDEAALLLAAYDVHRGRRDHLRTLLAGQGVTPTPPAPGYRLDADTRAPAGLLSAALDVERRCSEVYAQLVASSVGATRRWAADALADCAVRQLGFGGRPSAFPGAPELA
jgi:hypothetical protein